MPRFVEGTLDHVLGFEVLEMEGAAARARFQVERKHTQPFGIVHGGVYASLAEGLASASTYYAVKDDGMVAMGINNFTSFLRPVTEGEVAAEARAVHSGRTTWVWEVEFTSAGKPCATSRVTIAVRPMPSS